MIPTSYLFERLDQLTERLSYVIEREHTLTSVSWNTPTLELPINASAVFSFVSPLEGEGEGESGGVGTSAPKATQRGTLTLTFSPQLREHHHNTQLSDCPALIAEAFDVPAESVEQRVMWRARVDEWRVILSHKDSAHASGEAREGRLKVTRNVCYYHASTGLKLACEEEVRAEVLAGQHQQRLARQLRAQPHLPAVSCYWMSEYHYKRLARWPTHQDLPAYEYEAKLAARHLNVSELPEVLKGHFKIIERYQTESVRWYVKGIEVEGLGRVEKGRVGFRGARASLVMKGKKEKLKGGILKRREEKSQGLNTWALSAVADEAQEMRRIKRQLYICSQRTQRVYALCLDYCFVHNNPTPLLQVELEYNGKLLIKPSEWALTMSAQLSLAERLIDGAPKAALRCLERAALLSDQPRVTAPQRARLAKLNERAEALMSAPLELSEPEGEVVVDVALEAEVLEEMRALLEALKEEFGFERSSRTKRAWLKEALKTTIDQEPLL